MLILESRPSTLNPKKQKTTPLHTTNELALGCTDSIA